MNDNANKRTNPLAITSQEASFSLQPYDISSVTTYDPIRLTQPTLVTTLEQWITAKNSPSLLLVAPQESDIETWLKRTLLEHQENTQYDTVEYLVLWQHSLPLASYLYAPFCIISLETSQAQTIFHQLRTFSRELLYKLQTITQDTYLLQKEEEFTKELLQLEQQLLSPIKSLAKNFNLYMIEEENIRFKAFPKFQVMYQETLYSMEDLDHLYYQKEISVDTWQTIQQQHQAIMNEWQKAVNNMRQKEIIQEQLFHELAREYIINLINQHFDSLTLSQPHEQISQFLADARGALIQTMQYTPAPHHLSILEALPMPFHLSLINSHPEKILSLHYDEVHDLWGSYDIKEQQPQIELGKLLMHPHSTIILHLPDLLRQPDRWIAFKELLTTNTISLLPEQNSNTTFNFQLTNRFIIIAPPLLYESLFYQDSELDRIFPYFALWQSEVQHDSHILAGYHLWIASILQESFPETTIDSSMVELLIHHLIKYSENRLTISTHFQIIQKILQYFHLHQIALTTNSLKQAINAPRQQKSYIWQQMLQEIILGTVHIPSNGQAIGKVVALVVVDIAQEGYGLPTLLSATATAGKDGLINIEREAGLSGEIHDKGAFIAEAYIRHTLGRYNSLSITATLAFEQTYDGVEGDSATAAEVCAILSAIGNIPLNQSIGITGSMNQHGELQAIGGVTEKVEGFFALCQQRGLTGEHGVILPKQNLPHLFLSATIEKAIEDKLFHIWPCTHIHQALTLLSGIEVTEPNAKGRYKKETFFYHVEEELKRFSS